MEYVNYATDVSQYNMKEQELDAVIKFEVMDDVLGTRSFEVFDDRFGRIVAYSVA